MKSSPAPAKQPVTCTSLNLPRPTAALPSALTAFSTALQARNPMMSQLLQMPAPSGGGLPGGPAGQVPLGMQVFNPIGVSPSGAAYNHPYSAQHISPQKNEGAMQLPGGSNRRSPRAHTSSLAFDATRKQDPPLLSDRPASAGPFEQPGSIPGLFSPLASSSPAQGAIPKGTMVSPRSRKRLPTVTGNVLQTLLENKRAKKSPHQSPIAKGSENVYGVAEMKSQSAMKCKLTSDLDAILKETLKQGNFSKIQTRLDAAGLQVVAVQKPIPKDLFCYAVSLYMPEIQESDPAARAAVVRTQFMEFVVSQMLNFAQVSTK